MSATPIDRARLAELLQRYGDDLDSFDKLRPDSYEQQLAAYSLESLASFYAVIHEPGLTQLQAAAKCPTWPLGTKYERQRPSGKIVCQVQERFRTNSILRKLDPSTDFLKRLAEKIKATPIGDNKAVLDGVCAMVGEQLIADRLAGKPITENLKSIAALQNQESLALEREKLEQKKRVTDLLKFRVAEASCKNFLKWYADQKARDIAESNLSNADKISRLRQTYFSDIEELEKSGEVKLPE